MKIWKICLILGSALINVFAFQDMNSVVSSTIKCVRVNVTSSGVTQALFKINEASPTMNDLNDTKMNTYWFQVDLANQDGLAEYLTMLKAKFSGQQVQFLITSGTANADNVYPVQNLTYGYQED